MTSESTQIETSSQQNLEVIPPSNPPETDWASRLDSEINSALNSEPESEVEPEEKKTDPKIKAKSEKKVEKTTENSDQKEKSPEENAEKEETPKGLTEKAAVKWGELRAEAAKAKEYERELATVKAELEDLKSKALDQSEIEKLRALNEEYEQELATARVESTQAYKTHVVQPMSDVVNYVENLSKQYNLSAKEVMDAFSESDSQKQSELITDLASSMNERDRLRLYACADDFSAILQRRDFYKQASQERLARLEHMQRTQLEQMQLEQMQQAEAYKQEYATAVEKVFNDLKESVPMLEDEEVAEDVLRLAKGDYSEADAELKAYMSHSGALLPHLLKALKEAKSELEEANKKIVGYRNSSPKAGSGSADSNKDVPDDLSFLDALEQQLG